MTLCMIQCNDVNQSDVPLGLIELWLKISARVALFGSFGPLIVSGGLDSDLHITLSDKNSADIIAENLVWCRKFCPPKIYVRRKFCPPKMFLENIRKIVTHCKITF